MSIKIPLLSIFCILTLLTICAAIDPPVFPEQYQVAFNETTKLSVLSGSTNGKMYFDQTNNREFVTRQHGHHNPFCASVYKFSDTPCKRYLDFPKKKYCCHCCDSSHGCGIVENDWIAKNNGTFVGYATLDDGTEEKYAKWEIKGDSMNYYYHKLDELKTPRRLEQGASDAMDYRDYKLGISDPSVFEIPEYCTHTCGATTLCAFLRNQSFLRKE